MAEYTILQLSKAPAERRALLDQCIELEEQSLKGAKEMGESTLLPDILMNLLHLLNDRVNLEASPEEHKQLLEKALMYGEDVEKLSPSMDSEILADCLLYVARRTLVRPPAFFRRIRSKTLIEKLSNVAGEQWSLLKRVRTKSSLQR